MTGTIIAIIFIALVVERGVSGGVARPAQSAQKVGRLQIV